MLDFIHIGDYKTGTSWMQEYAYTNHPEIELLGDSFDNKKLLKLIHELIDAHDISFDGDKLKEQIQEQIKESSKKVGICREVFTTPDFISGEHTLRNAQRLRAVFGNVKIIYIIREQFDMIGSMYSQYIKIGGTLPMKKFIFDVIHSRGLIERLQYDKTIKAYQTLFGKENVYVDLFENFKYDKVNFLKSLYGFISVQNDFVSKNMSVQVNRGLSSVGAFSLRLLNKMIRTQFNNSYKFIPLNSFVKLFLSNKRLTKILLSTDNVYVHNLGKLDEEYRLNHQLNLLIQQKFMKLAMKIRLGKKLIIQESVKKELSSKFISTNKYLLTELKLPVNKYAYSL